MQRLAGQRGYSIVEVLVAVLVMGIGVLGVSALQMVSLQNNRSALASGEAVQLAYDLMDRIRANPIGSVPGQAYDGLGLGEPPPAAQDCVASSCSAAQMVNFDQALWKCSLGGFENNPICISFRASGVLPRFSEQPGLPGGDGSVAVNDSGVVTITVQWLEPDSQIRAIALDSRG
jgi:type IV pilus assembly protein PilV